ncbi:hypothetical protein BASA81_009847 [Batrachochytrium salamandrivorans]|nr:hypothetical protein BASA81_009847 [Batrachochytrium salamandrivorans]
MLCDKRTQLGSRDGSDVEFVQVVLQCANSTSSSGRLMISKDNQLRWTCSEHGNGGRNEDEEEMVFNYRDISKTSKVQNIISLVSLSQRFEFRFGSELDAGKAFARMSTPPPQERVRRKSLWLGGDEDEEEDSDCSDLFALQAKPVVDENTKPMDYRVAARMLASKQTSNALREVAAKHLATSGYAFVANPTLALKFSSLDEQVAWEKQEFNKILPRVRQMKLDDDKEKLRVEQACGIKFTRTAACAGGKYRYVDLETNQPLSAQEFAKRYREKILPQPTQHIWSHPEDTSMLTKQEQYDLAIQQETGKLHAKFDQALQDFNQARQELQAMYLS